MRPVIHPISTGVNMDKNKNHYRWFTNKECEYYPCHEFEGINCLFCFCPLYFNDDCGGEYIILKNGIKDCSSCFIPHSAEGYDHIVEQLRKTALAKIAQDHYNK